MTQYSLLLNKKGTILSITAVDSDLKKAPVRKKLTGRHFSHMIGSDCKKDLRSIMENTSRTRRPETFRTFAAPIGSKEGPVMQWTIQPKASSIFFPSRYLLVGEAS